MKRKWEDKVHKVEQLALQYERKPLCPAYKPKLYKPWQPAPVWKLFYRQTQAFSFAKSCKEDVHVFALESENKGPGQRIYLVTTYTELWFYYNQHRKTLLYCYEVIPEDSVCKLYFDLEFYKPANPEADGKKMVAQLIAYMSRKLDEWYDIKCSAADVLNLDSSTESKFSRHLIFLLPNAAFKDNIHVGNFIKTALDPVRLLVETNIARTPEQGMSNSNSDNTSALRGRMEVGNNQLWNMDKLLVKEDDLSFLIVKNKEGDKALFTDMGVYTKNRNFRLYKSSKLGKNVFLEVAEDNAYVLSPQKNISLEEQIFLSSLVSNVRFCDSLKILTCDTVENKTTGCSDVHHSSPSGGVILGYQSSPYPEIDKFILSLVNNHGVQGGIRQWNYFSMEELLVYDISKYHWCKNIGRAHKSNNIMLLVDLKREVWYQKCHDPVCRRQNFKSDYYPLPPEVRLPSIFQEPVSPANTPLYKGNQVLKLIDAAFSSTDERLKKEKAFSQMKTNTTSSYFGAQISSEHPDEYLLVMEENGTIEESNPQIIYKSVHPLENNLMLSLRDNKECINNGHSLWEVVDDDADFLEATEDAELWEIAASELTKWECDPNDLPDEVLLEAVQKLESSGLNL